MATYQSNYTGAQIDTAVGNALSPDTTLSVAGKTADAKAVGDNITDLQDKLTSLKLLDTKKLFDWALGGWGENSSHEWNYSSGSAYLKRRTCPHVLNFPYDTTFVLNNPNGAYRMLFCTFADYDSSKVASIQSSWLTTSFTVKANTDFIFSLAWTDETSATDVTNIYNELYDALSVICFGDVNNIRQSITAISGDLGIDIIEPVFNPGYIKSDGTTVISSVYNYSDKISVNTGDVVFLKTYNGIGYCICLYDNSDNFIKGLAFDAQKTDYEFPITSDGYIRTSCNNSYKDYAVKIYRAEKFISNTNKSVKALDDRVSLLENSLPSYWQTTIDNIVDTLNGNAVDFENHGDTFVFITDQHWKSNAQVSSKIIDHISKNVDLSLVISGGDLINTMNESKAGAINEILDYYKSFKEPHRILSTIGNHDVNTVANPDTSTYLTTAELYPLVIKREEKFTNTKGTELVNVFDNTSQKIRYIQICCYGNSFSSDIQTMLTEAITEKDNTWTIILISHAYWLNESTVATSFANAILSAMDNANATVACWLVGHVHNDVDTVLTSNGGKDLNIIATPTDSYAQMHAAGDVPYTMTKGTITEQCFDVVQIDTTAKTLTFTRVGAGSDRNFTY